MMYLPVLRNWSGSVVAKQVVDLLLNQAKLAIFLRYEASMHNGCIPFSVLLLDICGSPPFACNLNWCLGGSIIETFFEVLESITRAILLIMLLHALMIIPGTDIMLRLDKQRPKRHLASSLQLTVRHQSLVNRC